ncbi:hypothetical protein [Allokutzneria albata]|uniref:Fibronectin type-III domain-containing protein n=1 Tax=Allokutzneria albata TaxID=211114 RepID=A0A1G9ZHM2_ALLAB|nr:hypothetical protein [Allokutzneria albata]SDN20511.1 hypothetical protein SAMN04489726_5495 [Allokutzneria albata]
MSSGRLFRCLAVLLCGFALLATGPAALAGPSTPPPAASPFVVFDYYHLPSSGKLGWSPVEGAAKYHVLTVKDGEAPKPVRTVKATDEQFVEILVGTKFSPDRAAPNSAYHLRVQAEYADGRRSELSGEPVVYTEAPDTGTLPDRTGSLLERLGA